MTTRFPKQGVIHGRFQVLHRDHLQYLLAGFERCDYLWIGISNPDAGSVVDTDTCPHRSTRAANPLTYWERLLMVKAALEEAGISSSRYEIVPFPINRPERLHAYVPMDATFFLTINDDWSLEKKNTFESRGLAIEILWEKWGPEKGLSASDVRRNIANDAPWEDLVPPAVYRFLTSNGLDARIREAARAADACP